MRPSQPATSPFKLYQLDRISLQVEKAPAPAARHEFYKGLRQIVEAAKSRRKQVPIGLVELVSI